jgi:hypothetical protein
MGRIQRPLTAQSAERMPRVGMLMSTAQDEPEGASDRPVVLLGNPGEHRARRRVSKPRPTCAADRGPGGLAATCAAGSHRS